MQDSWQHVYVNTNSIQLHVVRAGPADGPLLILLHGFPEFWYGWRHQIDALAEAGYYVWAPDQRGYNLSDKPSGISAYSLDTLVADIIGLIDAAGRQKAIVVGHDWGAAVAWWAAVTYPNRIERLTVLNVPHPVVMKQFARRNLGQMLRSWYIGFFQLPKLPEFLVQLNNWHFLKQALRSSHRGTFSHEDIQHYQQAWAQPGASTAMINWYRAVLRSPMKRQSSVRVTVPTLIIWGVKDAFLKREMAQLSLTMCDNGRLIYLENATHWVQHEEPDRVTALIMESEND
jgi:pimeloyl-ACP methyl ester carboxylesterase